MCIGILKIVKNEFGIYGTLRNISYTGNYKPQPLLNKRDNNFARLLFAITRNKAFEKNIIGIVGIKFIIKCRKKRRQLDILQYKISNMITKTNAGRSLETFRKMYYLVEMYLNN